MSNSGQVGGTEWVCCNVVDFCFIVLIRPRRKSGGCHPGHTHQNTYLPSPYRSVCSHSIQYPSPMPTRWSVRGTLCVMASKVEVKDTSPTRGYRVHERVKSDAKSDAERNRSWLGDPRGHFQQTAVRAVYAVNVSQRHARRVSRRRRAMDQWSDSQNRHFAPFEQERWGGMWCVSTHSTRQCGVVVACVSEPGVYEKPMSNGGVAPCMLQAVCGLNQAHLDRWGMRVLSRTEGTEDERRSDEM